MEPQLSSYLITDDVDMKSTVCLWTSGWGCSSAVECLPSMHKVLGLILLSNGLGGGGVTVTRGEAVFSRATWLAGNGLFCFVFLGF